MNVPRVTSNEGMGLMAAAGFGADVSTKVIEGASPDAAVTRLTFSNPLTERRIAAGPANNDRINQGSCFWQEENGAGCSDFRLRQARSQRQLATRRYQSRNGRR